MAYMTESEMIVDLYKHITYLKRRAEVTDQVVQGLVNLALAQFPEREDELNKLNDAWTAATQRVNETYGHE